MSGGRGVAGEHRHIASPPKQKILYETLTMKLKASLFWGKLKTLDSKTSFSKLMAGLLSIPVSKDQRRNLSQSTIILHEHYDS